MTDPETELLISLGDLHNMIVHCVERAHFFTRMDMALDDVTSVVLKEVAECMQPVDANHTKQ